MAATRLAATNVLSRWPVHSSQLACHRHRYRRMRCGFCAPNVPLPKQSMFGTPPDSERIWYTKVPVTLVRSPALLKVAWPRMVMKWSGFPGSVPESTSCAMEPDLFDRQGPSVQRHGVDRRVASMVDRGLNIGEIAGIEDIARES